MTTPKKEPLSFAFTEGEIGNACRAAIVNRLQGDPDLVTAPFKAELELDEHDRYRATVTFWPKRVRRPRDDGGERMPQDPHP